MLLLAGARAGWLGVVRADSLQDAAATQQKQQIVVPARRGTITDVNGTELAVSQPAQTIAATPYLIKDPVGVATQARTDPRQAARTSCSSSSPGATPASSTSRAASRCAAPRAAQKLEIEGLEFIPEFNREYPRDWMASQLLGNVGTEGHGPVGARVPLRLAAARPRRRAAAGARRARRHDRAARGPADARRRAGAADARREHPGPHRGGARRGRRGVAAQGRDRARDGPARRLDHRARQLAAGQRQPTSTRRPTTRRTNRATGRDVRARLDVQGVHRRRRARGRQGHARRPSSACRPILQVADREITDAHARGWETRSVAGILAESSNVGAALIGRTLGARRFDQWVRRFGFGKPTGVDLPGEEAGILLDYDRLLRLDRRQHGDGPGPRGHADADGRRLRRDRQRRHPAPAAHRRRRSAAASSRSRRARA